MGNWQSSQHNAEIIELRKRVDALEAARKLSTGDISGGIDAYVDSVLSDSNVNVSMLPDYVEKKIYHNMFSIFTHLMINYTHTYVR